MVETKMTKEKKCYECAFSKQLEQIKTFESMYRNQQGKLTQCTIGYRILLEGKPGPGCDGKFFEWKKD